MSLRRLVTRLHTAMSAALVPAESGQSTAEYALVILGAVAIATLMINWATGSHAISKLFDTVVSKILPG